MQRGLGAAVAGGRERLNVERRPVDVVMESLETSTVEPLESADGLRAATVRKVGEIRSPGQTAEFMAATDTRLYFAVRSEGMGSPP